MPESTTTVCFLNRLGPDLIGYLKDGLDGLDVDLKLPDDNERESVLAILPEADVLIGWGSDPELLERAERLKLFINPGTGVKQHIETFREHRKKRPVTLANGHGNAYAVAQHTVGLLLALANKTIPHHRRMAADEQVNAAYRTVYFRGITVGLLGYGAINRKVHRFLSGFDIRFAACRRDWSRDTTDPPTEIERFTPDQLNAFFETCDTVVNALPATEATRGLVTMEQLKRLGERGLFVNVGRGATVVEADIYHALKDGVIAGAAIEVWWKRQDNPEIGRRVPYEYPFHELDNLVMSPHRAADSGGDLSRWDEVIENIKRVHAGRTDYLNVVDLEHEY